MASRLAHLEEVDAQHVRTRCNDPGQRSGSAVWLKCAIAGVLPEVQLHAL